MGWLELEDDGIEIRSKFNMNKNSLTLFYLGSFFLSHDLGEIIDKRKNRDVEI